MNKETRASWMGVAGRSVGSSYFNTSREEEVQAGEEEKEEERFVVPPTATSICDVFHTPADIGSPSSSTSLSRYPSNTHLYSHKDARRLGALVAVCSVLPTSHLLLARSDFQNLEKEEEENGKREEVRSPPTLNPCAPVSSHGEDDDHFYNGCAAENDHLRVVYSMLGHLRTEEALLLRELRGGSRSRGGDRGEEEEEKRNNKVEKKEPSNEFNVVASVKGRINHATNPTASHRSTDNDRSYSTTNGVQVGSNSNNRSAGVRPSPLPLTTTPIATTTTATSAPQRTAASSAVRELNSNTTGGVLRGSSRGGGGGGREGVVVAHQYVSGKPKPILGVRGDLHEVHIGDERNHSNPRHNNNKLGEAAEDGSIRRSSSKVLAAEKELLSLRGRILKIQSLIEGHAMREWEIFKRIVRACPLPYIVRYPTATHYSPALLDHGDGIPSMQTERARGREKVEVFAAGPSKRDLPPSRIKYIFFLMTSDTSPSRMRKALIYAQKSAGGRVLGVHIPHSRDRTSHHRRGKESVAVDHSDNFSGESSPNTSSSRSSSSSTSSTFSSSSSVRVADHRKGEGRRGNRTPPSSSLSPSHSYSSTSAYVPFNYLMLSHDFVSNSTTHGLHSNFSTFSSTSAGLPSFPASTCIHMGGESQRGVSKRCANEGVCFLVIHNLELASGAVTSVLLDAMKYGVVSATRAEALEACGLRGYFNGSLAEREESPEQKVAEETPQFLGAGSKREGKHRNHQNLFGEGSSIRNDRQEGGGSRAGNYDSNTSTSILGGKVEKERERRDKGGGGGEGGERGQTILRPTVAADEHHPSLRDPNETRHLNVVGGQSLDALCPAPPLSLPPHVVLFGEGPMCCGARLRSSTRAGEQFREVGSASLPPPRATATEKERKESFRIAIPIPCVRFVGITDSETLYEVDRGALSPSLREAFGLSTTITPSSLGLFPSVATAASKVENHGRAAVEKTVAQHAVDEEDRVGNEGMSRGDIREDLHIRRSPAFTEEERGDTDTEKTRVSKQARGRQSGEKRGEEMGGCDVAIQALEPCVVSADNLLFLLYGGGGRSRTTEKARRKGSKRRSSNKDLTGASSKLNSQFAIARGNRPAHSQGTPSRVRSRGRGSFADPMRADSSDCADESEREGNNGFLSSPLSDDDDDVDDDEDNDNGAMRGGEFIHSILQDDSFVFCAPFVSYYLRQLIVSLQMRTIPFSQQMTKVMGRNYYFITVLKCLAALLTPCNSLARSRARDAAVVRKGYPVGGIEGGLPVSRGTESCGDTHGIRKKSWGAFKCPPTNKEPAVPTPLVRAVVTVSDVICLLPHMTSHLLPINRLEMYSMSIPVRRMRFSSSSLLTTPTPLPDKKSSTIMFLKGETEGQRQQLNKASFLLTKDADAKKTAAAPRTMGSASKNQTKKSVENEPFVDLAVLLAAIQDEYANVLVSTDPSERREEEEESNHLLRRIVSSCLSSRREGTSEEDVGISESMHTRFGARQGAETIAASLTLGLGGPFNGGNRGAYTAGTQIRPISGLNMHAHSANTYGMMMADEQLETFSPLSFAVRPASPASGGQRQSTNIYSLSEAPKASGMISSRERNYMYAPSTSAKKALDAGNVYNDYAVLIPTSSLPRSTVAAWDMLGTNSDMVPWGTASWESTTIHQTISENTSRRGVPASCGVEGVSGRSGAPNQTRRADKETLSIRDGVEVKRDSDISCDSERLSLFYNRFHRTLEGQRLLELSVYVYALERRRAREILGVGVEKSIGRPEKSSRDADFGSAEVDVALLITSEIVDVVTSEIDCKNNRAFNRRRVASTRRMMNADRESQPNALFALFGAHESRKACLASVSEKPSRFDKVHELKEQRENVRKILFLSALEHLTFTEVFCLVSQCGYERSEGVEEEGLD